MLLVLRTVDFRVLNIKNFSNNVNQEMPVMESFPSIAADCQLRLHKTPFLRLRLSTMSLSAKQHTHIIHM